MSPAVVIWLGRFGVLDSWSLMEAGRLREVVATDKGPTVSSISLVNQYMFCFTSGNEIWIKCNAARENELNLILNPGKTKFVLRCY